MSLRGQRILITSGPTWVALDDMRVITNLSSGELGQRLTLACRRAGATITLLEGPVRLPPLAGKTRLTVHSFRYYEELEGLLKRELKKNYDIIIHAAAVSDFRPQRRYPGKVSSGRREWVIRLCPTEKLIDRIREQAPQSLLVGFKLADSLDTAVKKGKALTRRAGCDLLVANTLTAGYRAAIMDSDGRVITRAASREQLVERMVALISEK